MGLVPHRVPRRLTRLCLASVAALAASASSASASSIAVSVTPATAGETATLTYTGTLDQRDGSAVATLRSFAQPGAVACAASVDEMRARVSATLVHALDVNEYGPYSKVGEHVFDEAGSYTLCLYLQDFGAPGEGVVATATSALSVATSCDPPRLKGLTLAQAKRELADADCKLGKVTKPRRVPRRSKLVVKRQSGNDPVNIVLALKKAKRRS